MMVDVNFYFVLFCLLPWNWYFFLSFRLHSQALTLAALAGAAAVEYYEHKTGQKAKKYERHFEFPVDES